MNPCLECKNTFPEDELFECEACSDFICDDCIEQCGSALRHGGFDPVDCGGMDHLSHATHGFVICESYVDCISLEESEQKTKNGICETHSNFCPDCDTAVCWSCWVEWCDVCHFSSCIDCGSQCHSSGCDGWFCAEHGVRCGQEKCSLMFCRKCSQIKDKMELCEICDKDFCINHVNHECIVE